MPRYLVTLRHAETGETKVLPVAFPTPWGRKARSRCRTEAMLMAEEEANAAEGVNNPAEDVWFADHCCPADDEPVPFRDR